LLASSLKLSAVTQQETLLPERHRAAAAKLGCGFLRNNSALLVARAD